jgi:hypothetical protein
MKKALFFILLAVTVMVFRTNAQVTIFSEDFETGVLPADWTVIDADGDGQSWELFYQSHLTNYDGFSYASYSQNNLTPDNWLVTPAISLGTSSTLTFWRIKGFSSTSEHYGVYVSTTSATDTSSFTLLYEETPPFGAAWVEKTVDLSAYSNSTVYIAFRHYNCTNQLAIIIDEIEVTSTMSSPTITALPTSLQFLEVPLNTPSNGQLVTVNAINTMAPVTATVTSPFEISTDDTNYSLTATLPDTVHELYVRYAPVVVGADSGVLHLTSGTAITDVFLYGTSISCAEPTDLTVSTVTSTSAVLNWTGNSDSYNIYYKTSTETTWTEITDVPADSAGYTLTNLLPSTTYAWVVASVCDDGSLIYSEGTNMFTTGCAAVAAPFEENFDGSTSLPQCWSRYNGWASDVFASGTLTPATGGWGFTNVHVFGANHARLNIHGNSCNRWLVTPAIDLAGLTNPALTFELALTAWNNANPIADTNGQPDDKFMVIISTDDGATWSAANATVWSNDGTGDYVYNQIPAAGQDVTISLADYVGQTVKIAFYGESTVVNGDNDLHIDNVMVNFATSCVKPSNLSATTASTGSVTLSWTENGTATSWNVEYGPTGFQHGSALATQVQADTNVFTINNLGVAVYDFYVQANCGDELSLWVGPITAAPGSFNMGVTGSEMLTTCALIVYDNGGASGNYSANCDYKLTLMPEVSGNALSVSGSYHTEACCDYLSIYDGVDTSGYLLGEFKGNGIVPVLASFSGPLTIYFHSDGGMQYSGFELNVNCISCLPPGNLTVSNVGPDSAELAWTGSATSYIMDYKAAEDTVWTSQTLTNTSYTFAGLQPATTYTVNVYSDCGDVQSPSASITFTTTMAPAGIPFSTDFSSASGWVLNNGNCNSYWTIASVSETANALFVTANGSTPGYNTNSFSAVSAEKLFTVGTASELLVSFDVQVGGEAQFDYLKVFFAPVDEEYPAAHTNVVYTGEEYSTYAVNFSDYLQYTSFSSLPYKFNLTNGNTVSVSVAMPNPNANPDANSTAKLVFLWKNDSSDGSQPGAIVRSVSIEAVACPSPINLAVSNITTNSADITWNPSGSDNDWILEYRENDAAAWTSVPVSGTPAYTLTGLNFGTTYQVRVQTNCGEGNQSVWVATVFSTFCDAITTFPFIEDFEHDGQMPDCWTQEHLYGSTSWTFQAGADNAGDIHEAHGGNYNAYLFVASSEGPITRLASPVLDLSGMLDAYVTFWYAQQSWGADQDHLTVYYRSSPNDQWQMLTQYPSSVSAWTMDSIALPNLSATYQIAFQGLVSYGHGIVLDDITVNGTLDTTVVPEPCEVPTNLHQEVSPSGELTSTVQWTDVTGASQWNVQYAIENADWTTETVNTTSFQIPNIQYNTTYNVRVRAVCDDGETSDWTGTISMMVLCGIEDWLENSVTLFPNPAKEVINVECTMNNVQFEVETVEVYDVYGKLVNTVVVNENPIRINISNLADGMYFVRVTTEKGAVTKRFVKR